MDFVLSRKLCRIISSVLLLVFFLLFSPWRGEALEVSGSSAILIEAQSGRVLWEKNSNHKQPIASTTKIMTAIVTLEEAGLDEEVKIGQDIARVGESSIDLSPGEKWKVEDLLYALLLKSANDAAVALAEHVGGSVDKFVRMMNQKASLLRAKDTEYTNPHGLDDTSHFSTAYDLVYITRYALKNKVFSKIVATKSKNFTSPSFRQLKNHNKLLWNYPYATGVKTGYTSQSGHCLVSSAKKEDLSLISVVLGSPTAQAAYDDSIKLLNYGFDNFSYQTLIEKGNVYRKLKIPFYQRKLDLVAKENLKVLVPKNKKNFKKLISLSREIKLPITKGEKFGQIRIMQEDKFLGRTDLVAGQSFRNPTLLEKIRTWISSFL